jgi:hypothetical protein
MTITVESRKKQAATLARLWPGATIIDLTSKGEEPWVRFSPFYPHGGIPIPNSSATAASVEGLWQGLKVFEKEDIDPKKWSITTMSGIKRSGKSRGQVLGHRLGIESETLLGYLDARRQIYLPAYRWVLENRLQEEVKQLRAIAESNDLILRDYETNGDVNDLSSPLSHAALVNMWLEGSWP